MGKFQVQNPHPICNTPTIRIYSFLPVAEKIVGPDVELARIVDERKRIGLRKKFFTKNEGLFICFVYICLCLPPRGVQTQAFRLLYSKRKKKI